MKIVDINTLTADIQKLCSTAVDAMSAAYCPHSNFQVGAALLGADGSVFKGCNVENRSYGATICAERTAICSAVANGQRTFKAIAVAAKLQQPDTFTTPCGICRQLLMELAEDLDVFCVGPDSSTAMVTSMAELVPFPFK